MEIAVLDYSVGSADIVEVSEEFIDEFYDSDVERFLGEWCGYCTSNCYWMSGDTINSAHLDINSFGGDDELELSENDRKKFNITIGKEDEA